MRELKSVEEAREFLQSGDLQPVAFQDIDLRPLAQAMQGRNFSGCLFLGCDIDPAIVCQLASDGAFIINDMEDLSFPLHRSRLYSPDELFAGFDPDVPLSHAHTLDYRIYREYLDCGGQSSKSIKVTLARRLHDHSITEALNSKLSGHKVVAVMGGHGLERRSETYATVATLSRRLAREGFLLVSGGGPGAMEATHLGAYFATRSQSEMEDALTVMSVRPEGSAPNREYADHDWLQRAWRVRERYPIPAADLPKCESIGVPTWTYGHEPPAVFATHIAKYFANSVREDGLLTIAAHGVVFAPGSAGTIQEIFQDACQNHYFTADNQCSPMILLDRKYWTEDKPVWPLLSKLADGHKYGELLSLTDSVEEIVRRLLSFRPELYRNDFGIGESDQ